MHMYLNESAEEHLTGWWLITLELENTHSSYFVGDLKSTVSWVNITSDRKVPKCDHG